MLCATRNIRLTLNAAAAKFTRDILEKRLGRPVGPVFEVSAAERSEGRGPLGDWSKLLGALQQLVDESGAQIVRAACASCLAGLTSLLDSPNPHKPARHHLLMNCGQTGH